MKFGRATKKLSIFGGVVQKERQVVQMVKGPDRKEKPLVQKERQVDQMVKGPDRKEKPLVQKERQVAQMVKGLGQMAIQLKPLLVQILSHQHQHLAWPPCFPWRRYSHLF